MKLIFFDTKNPLSNLAGLKTIVGRSAKDKIRDIVLLTFYRKRGVDGGIRKGLIQGNDPDIPCDACGKFGRHLDLHHITPFWECFLVFDMEADHSTNLIRLCPACHFCADRERPSYGRNDLRRLLADRASKTEPSEEDFELDQRIVLGQHRRMLKEKRGVRDSVDWQLRIAELKRRAGDFKGAFEALRSLTNRIVEMSEITRSDYFYQLGKVGTLVGRDPWEVKDYYKKSVHMAEMSGLKESAAISQYALCLYEFGTSSRKSEPLYANRRLCEEMNGKTALPYEVERLESIAQTFQCSSTSSVIKWYVYSLFDSAKCRMSRGDTAAAYKSLVEAAFLIDEFRFATLRPPLYKILSMYLYRTDDPWRALLSAHVALRLHRRLAIKDGRDFAIAALLTAAKHRDVKLESLAYKIRKPCFSLYFPNGNKGDEWAARRIAEFGG